MNSFDMLRAAKAVSGQAAPPEALELAKKAWTHEDRLAWKVQDENHRTGNLIGYNCEKCKNRGHHAVAKDGFMVLVQCECMSIRETIGRIKRSGFGDALETKTFDTYEVNHEWQAKAVEMCKKYCTDKSLSWLFFGGQNGSGKTHLCTAICGTLIDGGHDVMYASWTELFKKLDALKYKHDEYADMIGKVCNAEVLYLDDFLKSKTEAERIQMLSTAFDIINKRVEMERKTIISSEMFIDEISALDEAIAGRIRRAAWNYRIQIQRDDSRNYRKSGGAQYDPIL